VESDPGPSFHHICQDSPWGYNPCKVTFFQRENNRESGSLENPSSKLIFNILYFDSLPLNDTYYKEDYSMNLYWTAEMQKHPSSLEGLVDISRILAEIFKSCYAGLISFS
jgi:hypothetical protein